MFMMFSNFLMKIIFCANQWSDPDSENLSHPDRSESAAMPIGTTIVWLNCYLSAQCCGFRMIYYGSGYYGS